MSDEMIPVTRALLEEIVARARRGENLEKRSQRPNSLVEFQRIRNQQMEQFRKGAACRLKTTPPKSK
jgi:hypothetical protein